MTRRGPGEPSAEPTSKDLEAALLACEAVARRRPRSATRLRSFTRPVSELQQYRVDFPDGSRRYWIKRHRDASADLRDEYEFLVAAHERLGSQPELAVVRPVAFLPELPALVTEHAPGATLSVLTKRRRNRAVAWLSPGDVERAYYRCGQWLALLHDSEPGSAPAEEARELADYVDHRLKFLSERELLGAADRERVLAYLARAARRVAAGSFGGVRVHGDYAPYNVLAGKRGIVVTDPAVGGYFRRRDYRCPRHEDVVHFYRFTEELSPLLLGRRARHALAESFLRGYNDHAELTVNTHSPAFRMFLLKYKLLGVLGHWPSLGSRRGAATRVRAFLRWFDASCVA